MNARIVNTYQLLKETTLLNAPYWISAIVTGIFSYAYAQAFHLIALAPSILYSSYPWAVFIGTPILFVLSWFVVERFSIEASGSGIPQAMASHELDCHKYCNAYQYLVGIKTSVVKIISSFLILLGGGAIGREGPTIQISASIFYYITNKMERRLTKKNLEFCILAGSAAGLASAFNTPLGGIVYAIEELPHIQFHKSKTILISAVIISGLVALSFSGPYLYLGYPNVHPFKLTQLPVIILTAIISGILGGLFGKLLYKLLRLKSLFFKSTILLAKVTFILGLLMAAMIYFGNEYAMGPGNNMILNFLFVDKHFSTFGTVVERFFGPLISSLTGAGGGIFAPSLAAGASIGSYISYHFSQELENLLVLMGMIGFLTGVTRAPFTSFILVLEMTNRHANIFPMMLSSLMANMAATFIDKKSFYEKMKVDYIMKFENCCSEESSR